MNYFMKKEKEKDIFLFCASIIIIIATLAGSIYLHIKRVEAYNRATGSNISVWDAWFLDLRVVGEVKPSDE